MNVSVKSKHRKASPKPVRSGAQKPRPKRFHPLSILFVLVMLGVFCFSLYKIVLIQMDYRKAQKGYSALFSNMVTMTEDSDYKTVNYAKLLEANPDFVAWLDIPGTNISYPIVQSLRNNDDYLRTTFQGEYATAGSIFIDYRCANPFIDKLTVIYGHRMNDDTMFAQLKKYLQESFWKDHQEIHIYNKDGIEIYKVFSSYTAPVDDECYAYDLGGNEQSYSNWVGHVVGQARYRTNIGPAKNSRSILLSTCVYQDENSRNVVAAVYDRTEKNP